jgi:intraflagellar transport protein 52
VSSGVLNREVSKQAGKQASGAGEGAAQGETLNYLYPYGATLSVQKPAIPVLSSGPVCFPLNRPTCALYHDKGAGKLAVLGSCHMFTDQYLDKEDNGKLLNIIVDWLTSDLVQVCTSETHTHTYIYIHIHTHTHTMHRTTPHTAESD